MKIAEQDLAAIRSFGYTESEARFLYIVGTYSGFFLPRQLLNFWGSHSGDQITIFTERLATLRHAAWREYPSIGLVYQLLSKIVCTQMGKWSPLGFRRFSAEFVNTRLTLLDFVIANQQHDDRETEADNATYFAEALRIPKLALTALPVQPYPGLPRLALARRYFVDEFPSFLDRTDDLSDSSVALCYVDPGEPTVIRFRNCLEAYRQLLSDLPDFQLLYVSDSTINLAAAEQCFGQFCRSFLPDRSPELIKYFVLRTARNLSLKADLTAWLDQARAHFASQDIEHLYAAWRAGWVANDQLETYLTTMVSRRMSFRPYLVPRGEATKENLAQIELFRRTETP